jgi:hypothetical protein
MAHEIITPDDLEKFRIKLLADIQLLIKPAITIQKEWIKSSEVRKLLGISPGTLQNLRVNGTLAYSKVGSIIFYKHVDVINALEKVKQQANA